MFLIQDHVVLQDVGNDPHPLAPTVPANAFMIYQWSD